MRLLFLISILVLTACASVDNRRDGALNIINASGYQYSTIQTSTFPIFSAFPATDPYAPQDLNIVIEGDGYAFVSRTQPSGDPTPKNPIGLYLAMKKNAIYLARPCQFVRNDACRIYYWTTGRFDAQAYQALNQAIDNMKKARQLPESTKVNLIGYSGGAYMAMLLAATRNDIKHVETYAGLLSPEDWTEKFKLTPLQTPLSSAAIFDHTSHIPMIHHCGVEDKIIPCDLSAKIINKYARNNDNHHLIKHPEKTHSNWIYKK